MSESARSRLRTKTGCLTCRNRRKKCDERGPICSRCRTSKRQCLWPSFEELKDRRHGPRRISSTPPPSGTSTEIISISAPALSMDSEALAGRLMARDVEPLVSQNFFERYFDMIILPGCHPKFYHGWIHELRQLMVQHPSLYYSILACSSSQVYALLGIRPLKELTLEYYSRSLKGVAQLLKMPDVATHNGLLMSIILLYIHGCLGQATFNDIPRHLDAAVHLLQLRFFDQARAIEQPFDRIAIESVLYQIFIMSMGLWSQSDHPEYRFDVCFWMQAENLLAQSTLFPEHAPSANSPILGVPLKLLRLLLTVRQVYRHPEYQDSETVGHLQQEMEEWEALVLCEGDHDGHAVESSLSYYDLYKSATYFYVLITSLLLDQLSESLNVGGTILEPRPASTWQSERMFQILDQYVMDEQWSRSYIVNWCIYSLGFFASTSACVSVVRHDLEKRHGITGASQVRRFLDDLGPIWSRRDLVIHD